MFSLLLASFCEMLSALKKNPATRAISTSVI
jgi:hypothetical protein